VTLDHSGNKKSVKKFFLVPEVTVTFDSVLI
jgi:hypothetical protein